LMAAQPCSTASRVCACHATQLKVPMLPRPAGRMPRWVANAGDGAAGVPGHGNGSCARADAAAAGKARTAGVAAGLGRQGLQDVGHGGDVDGLLGLGGHITAGHVHCSRGARGGRGGGGHRQDWYSQHTQLLAAGWMAAGLWHTQASVVCRQSALQAVLPEQASACQSKPSSRFVGCRGLHADHGARRTCLCWVPPC